MERQYVAFETAGNHFCIDIMDVQEVAREQSVTHMPDFPSFVEGVINLRGTVTPIISIQKRIRHSVGSVKSSGRSIRKYMIVKIAGVTVGLVVDVLDKIVTASETDIHSVESMGHDSNLVKGLIRADETIYLVLDVNGLLCEEEAVALEKSLNI